MIKFLKENMFECVWYKSFGIECPGCGLQRSLFLLLEGKIVESLIMFPALLPTLILFFYMILHLIFKFKQGPKWLIVMFIFVLIIMAAHWAIKQMILHGII